MSEEVGAFAKARPRYCARCDRDAETGGALCHACGDPIFDQGYCPICERYWRLARGSACPKHEVPLEAEPIPSNVKPAGHWVTVATFGDDLKAEAPRIRLEAEGIPTFLEGGRMGSFSMYPVATGGVKLQVPHDLAADARVILAQSWAPVVNPDDLDDAWEELAPEPGARRRRFMKAAIVVVLLGPGVIELIASLLGL